MCISVIFDMGAKRFRRKKNKNNVQGCVSSTVKILKLLNANDNVEFDYALAA